MNAFIFHGVYGHSKENWFPWLKNNLEQNNIETVVLDFPTPNNQTLENWIKIIKPFTPKIDEDTIFIGHSLGTLFSFHVLSTIDIKVNSLFLVAPFEENTKNKEINSPISSFINTPINWDKVNSSIKYSSIYASFDDPYIPLKSSLKVAKFLNIEKINLYLNAGHFNEKIGYITFNDLLRDILSTKL